MPSRIRPVLEPPGAYREFRVWARNTGLQLIGRVERSPTNPMSLQEIFTNIDNRWEFTTSRADSQG